MTPERFALYAVPSPAEPWAGFCTRWLGWDAETGHRVAHPDLSGLPGPLSAITAAARRYGFHATIKPPFRLATGRTPAALERAAEDLATELAPVTLDGLAVTRLGRFLALTPRGAPDAINDLAARVVQGLDPFRAPAPPHELEKRRAAKLTPAQDANLLRWGYPYVMDQFRFHMTLTGKLPRDDLSGVEKVLADTLLPLLPKPFVIRDLALMGEDADGYFHVLNRYPLGS